jgi:urease accessory protein
MRVSTLLLTGAATLLPVAARAHEGHVHDGRLAGLMHPVGGLDHLLVTLGLGLVAGFAALRPSNAVSGRATPSAAAGSGAPAARIALAVMLGLLAGACWILLGGRAGAAMPQGGSMFLEQAVCLGLLAVAALVLAADRLGSWGLGAVALMIAAPHGALHAIEATGGVFFVGLGLSSAALFALGVFAGRRIGAMSQRPAARMRWALAGGFVGAFAGFATLALR